MVHIDRIYTRSGDNGETGLGDGSRISKLDARIIAGGSVDETNCAIGIAISAGASPEIANILKTLQQFLFDLGADLCVPIPVEGPDPLPCRISQAHVEKLERLIDRCTEQMEPLRSFVLPGGHPSAAALHLARSICRRAEIDLIRAHKQQPLNTAILIAINRLSDLLFVLARVANDFGNSDVLWQPGNGLVNPAD